MSEEENKVTQAQEQTTQNNAETAAEKPESKMKAWREYKKQKKIAKRKALEDEYKNAPEFIRVFRLKILKPLIWVLVILLVLGIGVFAAYKFGALDELAVYFTESMGETEVTLDEIYAVSPLDDEGKNTIESLPTYPADDTWTICVYMIGSNLESYYENDLSEVTDYLTSPIYHENMAENSQEYRDLIDAFVYEIGQEGMTLPDYFFIPTNPEASIDYEYDEVIATDEEGSASSDLDEMMSAEFGDNIKIVVQTGGAKRWSNSLINPNKIQRFEVSSGGIEEIEALPLQDSCSVDTLTDFLQFCEDNYSSDHKILIFWDHGGGAFGFGSDEIFGTHFTNAELRTALASVYGESPENPPFEVIGFDACLMASMEACHELYGYGKYLAASEESEPCDGWDYTSWINAFAQEGATNGARIAMHIADSYTDHFVKDSIQKDYDMPTEFSVVDIDKAEDVYNKYCDFAKTALVAATENQGVLADIGRAGERSVRYGEYDYNIVNEVDIGTFMDQLIDVFPEESSEVKNALNEAVVYNRQSGFLTDSQGLSVFLPVYVDNLTGLGYYLKYIGGIACDNSIKALYYYKLGGCLNDELTEYALSIGCTDVPVLDVQLLNNISKLDVTIEDGNYSVALTPETENIIQSYQMQLARYDENEDAIIYYGNDNYAYLDGDGNLATAFEGQWVSIDGQMLYLEIVDEAPSSIQYRTEVMCNGVDTYMLITYDRDTEEFTISGIRDVPNEYDVSVENVADRNLKTLEIGDKLIPVYPATDNETGKKITIEGDAFKYSEKTKVEMCPIENGDYFTFIVVTDSRGDEYYTQILEFNYDKDGITDLHVNSDYSIVKTEG